MKAPNGYVSLLRLARAMKVSSSDTYRWRYEGRLTVHSVGKGHYMTMSDACAIVKMWRRTYAIDEAMVVLGLRQSQLRQFRKRKRVMVAKSPLGYDRITKKSVHTLIAKREKAKLKKEKAAQEKRRKAVARYIGIVEAASILDLPVWYALTFLRSRATWKKNKNNKGRPLFLKGSVEQCKSEHTVQILRFRTTGKEW